MALEETLRYSMQVHGIQGRFQVEGLEFELPVDVQHNVLRICQEAIANAARHGAPSRIDVTLGYEAGRLRAVVRDNGCGFASGPAARPVAGHYGMAVMQERARRHGGQIRIDSRPGEGTLVEATVPLHQEKRT